MPYTASADEMPDTSLGAVRIPKRAQGRCSCQAAPQFLAFRASFSLLWNLSTSPLLCGWYAVVMICCMPRVLQRHFHTAPENCDPRSVVMVPGTPKRATQCAVKLSAQFSAVMSERGTASGHLVVRSTMVSKYLLPLAATGRGPTISTWTCENLPPGTGMTSTSVFSCTVTLLRLQCWHSLHQAATSVAQPGQTNLLLISRLLALMPGCERLWMVLKMCLLC